MCVSTDASTAVSVGFAGEARIWKFEGGTWIENGEIRLLNGKKKPGEIWAVALSAGDGKYLAATTYDGRVNVWDLQSEKRDKITQWETKGSFGMCIDLVCPSS